MPKIHKNLMIICSLIAVGTIAVFFLLRIPVKNGGLGLMLLICPLSHLLMMKFMGHGHGDEHHHDNQSKEMTSKTFTE